MAATSQIWLLSACVWRSMLPSPRFGGAAQEPAVDDGHYAVAGTASVSQGPDVLACQLCGVPP